MFTVMAVQDSESIRELKLTAKWGINNEEKKKAISELLQYGNEGASAIREILAVTSYADIKQACIDAIKSIARKQAETPHKVVNSSKKITKGSYNKHSVARRSKRSITKKKGKNRLFK
jgi:hypothetical protein